MLASSPMMPYSHQVPRSRMSSARPRGASLHSVRQSLRVYQQRARTRNPKPRILNR
ncbi:unnamed protein product [Symbiodinium sp. CCMP2592]|nr:unnamed protein product [Symbiodinium sp. CCMP2592]